MTAFGSVGLILCMGRKMRANNKNYLLVDRA